MKLTILKEKLSEGLKICERITQKNFALPILQTTLFSAEKNFLKLSTTNLESGVNWWGLAKIEKEGKLCLPTRFFFQYIENLPPKPIIFSLNKLSLEVQCESYKSEFVGVNPEDFPIIPQPQNIEPILMPPKIFWQNLAFLYKIPSSSSSRPEISGILIEFEENLIKMVATDSFRLLETKAFLPGTIARKGSFILPQTSAREIINIFGEKEQELRIYLSPTQLWLESLSLEANHPSIQYTTRLIEGEYPKYEEIIPKKFNTVLYLRHKEFLSQIKAASLFSGKSNEVKLKANPVTEQLIISSQSPNLGRYESALVAKIKGKEMELSFNWRFLIEGLLDLKSEEVTLSFTGHDGPAMISSSEQEGYLYLLMPIKNF